MLKMINGTIDDLLNSKEMKDTATLLLSENEIKIIECIKKNVLISAKEIIEETNISDRTVRRILKKLIENDTIEAVGNTENSPNKKYKLKVAE
jgi:predicted HTH transcriptional regulator